LDKINFISFPRTATTYCCEAFKIALPNYHSQIIYHKIDSLKKEKNVVTVVRKPELAIRSTLEIYKKNDVDLYLDWYIEFMEETLNRLDDIFVTTFDEVTNDINKVINKYCMKKNIKNPHLINTKFLLDRLKTSCPGNIPAKRKYKTFEKKILYSNKFSTANNIYNKILKSIVELPG
jgi:cellulose biosynthesis protein BcsQ